MPTTEPTLTETPSHTPAPTPTPTHAPALTLATAKQLFITKVNDLTNKHIANGVSWHTARRVFIVNVTSQTVHQIANDISAANASVNKKTMYNGVTVTLAELQNLQALVNNHIASCNAEKAALIAKINACTTIDQVEAVDIIDGVPVSGTATVVVAEGWSN